MSDLASDTESPELEQLRAQLAIMEQLLEVHERTSLEQATRLEEAEHHLRSVLDSVIAFAGVLTSDGTMIEANRPALEVAGLDVSDVVGRPFEQTYWWSWSSELQSRIRESVDRAASGEASRFDVVARIADEQYIAVDYSIRPLFDQSGRVTHLVPSGVDISDRKKEEQLRRAEQVVTRALATTSNVEEMLDLVLPGIGTTLGWDVGGFWMIDDEKLRCVRMWAAEPEELHGFVEASRELTFAKGDGLPGLAWQTGRAEWISDAPAEAFFHRARSAADHGLHSGFAFPLRTGGETIGTIEFYARKKLTADTKLLPMLEAIGAMIGQFLQRQKAEEALRQEVDLVRTLSRIGGDITARLDVEDLVQAVTDEATRLSGAEFGAFFYNVINEQGEAFLLYSLSGAPREAFSKFPLPRNTPIFAPTFGGEGTVRLDDVMADPRYGQMAPHHGMPKGHLPVRSYLAVPVILSTGEVLGGLFFGHSKVGVFTERHEQIVEGISRWAALAMENARSYQAMVKARSQAESAVRGRDDVIAFVSHDLKSPVAAMTMAAGLLESEEALPDSAREVVADMRASAERMNRLIQDLLDASKLEAGHFTVRPRPTAVDQLLDEAARGIRLLCEQKGITLSLDEAMLPLVLADREPLLRVLANLLSNALKFTPSGGEIRLAASVSGSSGDPFVRFSVADSGSGIEPEELPRIFDRFWQASAAREGGSGLGLAIAKGIVEQHGGTIGAESEPGAGTTVWFTIPVAKVDEKRDDGNVSE